MKNWEQERLEGLVCQFSFDGEASGSRAVALSIGSSSPALPGHR